MIIKLLIKKEQKELLEYNSYRSFADKFYNTSQFQKEEKERNEYNSLWFYCFIANLDKGESFHLS